MQEPERREGNGRRDEAIAGRPEPVTGRIRWRRRRLPARPSTPSARKYATLMVT